MKKLWMAIAIAIALLPLPASAQNWTTVTASNITDLNQNKLAAGQLCFLVTDQNDVPISVNIGGGGQNLKRPYCAAVTAGASAAFTVPNPASTNPAGIYYRVTVKDAATGLEVLRYTQVTFTGGSFNFDNYAPQNVSAPAPINNSVNGNFTVNGNESITGTSTAGAYMTPTRGDRQIVLQNPDFEGSSVLPPPGWRNLANSIGTYYSYETSSPAPGKTQSLKLSTTTQNMGVQSVTYFSAAPGDTYTVRGMAKSDGTGIASLGLACYNDTPAGNTFVFVGFAGQATTTSTTWVQIAAGGTVPANAVSCIVALQNTSATQPSSVWFDQISIQKTSFPGVFIQYNSISTVSNGVPSEYATVDNTANTANVGLSTLYSVPASGAGLYRVSAYVIVNRAATTSSTLPNLAITWTDQDNSTSQPNGLSASSASPSGNTLTTFFQTTWVISVKASTAIQYQTGNSTAYASSGATSMQYSIHLKVEAL